MVVFNYVSVRCTSHENSRLLVNRCGQGIIHGVKVQYLLHVSAPSTSPTIRTNTTEVVLEVQKVVSAPQNVVPTLHEAVLLLHKVVPAPY